MTKAHQAKSKSDMLDADQRNRHTVNACRETPTVHPVDGAVGELTGEGGGIEGEKERGNAA